MRIYTISFGLALISFIFFAPPVFAATKIPGRPMEFSLWAGFSPVRVIGKTTIADTWSSFLLNSVNEQTKIRSRAVASAAAGFSFSFFYSPHLGLQVLAGYATTDLTPHSAFDFSYEWADGTAATKRKSWEGSGRLTRTPVCLNLVWRQGAGRFVAEVSGGPALYWNELRQGSTFGYGVTRIFLDPQPPGETMTQSVDALLVPLTVPKMSWRSAGANLGGSLSIRLADLIGLKAEARYFYCPPKRIAWKPQPGTYDGLFGGGITAEPFTADDIAYLAGIGQKLEQKTELSFFQLSLGVIFFLGRRLPS